MFRWVKGCLPTLPLPLLLPCLSLSADLVLGLGYTNFHYAMQISDNCWAALPCPDSAQLTSLSLSVVFTPSPLPPLFASPHSLLCPSSLPTLPTPQFCPSLHSLPALNMPQHTYVAPLSSASFTPLYSTLLYLSPSPLPPSPLHSIYCFSHAIQQCNCQGFFGFFSRCFHSSASSPSPPWAAPHHSHALASKGS